MFEQLNPDRIPLRVPQTAVVIAGTAYTDATTGITPAPLITVSSPTNLANGGLQLPPVTLARDLGAEIVVYAKPGTNTCAVYPETGGTINGGAANAAVTLANGSMGRFICTGAATWIASEAPAA